MKKFLIVTFILIVIVGGAIFWYKANQKKQKKELIAKIKIAHPINDISDDKLMSMSIDELTKLTNPAVK